MPTEDLSPKVAIFIPARLESIRLPGKLLLDVGGKPLICYSIDTALGVKNVDTVFVATDNEKIACTVRERYGDKVELCITGEAKNGTDRIRKAITHDYVKYCHYDIIVNLQADVPDFPPAQLGKSISKFKRMDCEILSFCHEIESDYMMDESMVKVVLNEDHDAMYFSRSHIPYDADRGFGHIGVYMFKRHFFMREFPHSTAAKRLQCEALEQLEWLVHKVRIHMHCVDRPVMGIDTYEDYQEFVRSTKT